MTDSVKLMTNYDMVGYSKLSFYFITIFCYNKMLHHN